MKRNYILSLLFAGVFVFSMAGVALANSDDMSSSGNPPRDEMSNYAPGSWTHEGPVEAGSLAIGEDLSSAKTVGDEGFTLREFGGISYRLEVDTE